MSVAGIWWGARRQVVLGRHDERVWVTVRGRVQTHQVTGETQRVCAQQRLVPCLVDGETRERDIAVERFVDLEETDADPRAALHVLHRLAVGVRALTTQEARS